jgi:hypothetical protein
MRVFRFELLQVAVGDGCQLGWIHACGPALANRRLERGTQILLNYSAPPRSNRALCLWSGCRRFL